MAEPLVTSGEGLRALTKQGAPIALRGQTIRFNSALSSGFLAGEPDEAKLETERKQLLDQVEGYFAILAETLHDDPDLRKDLLNRLQAAKQMALAGEAPLLDRLTRAQFEVHTVHVSISAYQEQQRRDHRLFVLTIVVSAVQLLLVLALIVFGKTVLAYAPELPVVGIPTPVFAWAWIGSIACALYRLYTRPDQSPADEIIRVIARPIVGIVMGAVSYLAIVSGLLVFGATTEASVTSNSPQQLFWIIAFLVGFSDRFIEALIGIVGDRFLVEGKGEEKPAGAGDAESAAGAADATPAPAT